MSERSSDVLEKQIIQAILEGEFKQDEPLLPERELAAHFQVGRPAVREVLQRLERDGWITQRKGMPSIVRNYKRNGNLLTIVRMVQMYDRIPDNFIQHMLEVRISLTPAYIKDAVLHHPLSVISLFSNLDELENDPLSYAMFDWGLQRNLAALSPNPVYLFILNTFNDVYLKMGETYFQEKTHRQLSLNFYQDLLDSLLRNDLGQIELITQNMMTASVALWKEKTRRENGEI
ncbi:GntR family transcriptional regulator [Bacillus sp. 2205SS5-2]|uniref:GntR family transcriptional regulator n=1 Tax=Bacillus sp. 2205SS5-2 TaxID=3109031 RepID=UPI00300618BB